jgi:regulator of cell morphogenesis and NO signaling
MNNAITGEHALGAIVSLYPGSVELLNENKIDYCCGGKRSLGEALEERGLDISAFVSNLNERYQRSLATEEGNRDWREADPIEIIDHIQRTHHVFTKKELVEIDALLFTVLKVHFGTNGDSLLEIHNLFGTLKTELEEHLIKEEENLFPLIEQYVATPSADSLAVVQAFVASTEGEHEVAGGLLHRIDETTNHFVPPKEACTSYELVYKKLEMLMKDIFNHIHLENNVLFELLPLGHAN